MSPQSFSIKCKVSYGKVRYLNYVDTSSLSPIMTNVICFIKGNFYGTPAN